MGESATGDATAGTPAWPTTEHTPSSPPQEHDHGGNTTTGMLALHGIRALAVLSAIAAHMSFQLSSSSSVKAHAVVASFTGVNALFILSGFFNASILTAEFRRRGTASPRDFLARRAIRIVPPLLVVVAVVLAWVWLGPVGTQLARRTTGDAVAALTFTTSWARVLGLSNRLSFFAALWALSVEVQFYVILAFSLGWALRRWGPGRVAKGIAWLTLFFVAERAFVTWLNVDRAHGRTIPQFFGTPDNLALAFERTYYTIDGHADAILIGTLLGVLIGSGLLSPARFVARMPQWVWPACIGVLVLWWVGLDLSSHAQFWFLNAFGGWTMLGIAQGLLLLWILGRPSRPASFLARPAFHFLGDISYGAYLWHWPVMLVLTDSRLGHPPVGLRILIQTVTFVGLAILTRRFVEIPLLARKKRFSRVSDPVTT